MPKERSRSFLRWRFLLPRLRTMHVKIGSFQSSKFGIRIKCGLWWVWCPWMVWDLIESCTSSKSNQIMGLLFYQKQMGFCYSSWRNIHAIQFVNNCQLGRLLYYNRNFEFHESVSIGFGPHVMISKNSIMVEDNKVGGLALFHIFIFLFYILKFF